MKPDPDCPICSGKGTIKVLVGFEQLEDEFCPCSIEDYKEEEPQ